ncbi:MAG TPA: type II secretion system protein N [Pseudomonadales bacterium]|nr:type II secretion system protein N [Pseudomonadales bacterium]
MLNAKRLSILGILAFLLFLLAEFPAALVWSALERVAGGNLPVRISNVGGSIWSGHLSLSASGQELLPGSYQLAWQLKPWYVLLGKLRTDINLKGQFVSLEGGLGAGLGLSSYQLDHLNGKADAALVNKILENFGVSVESGLRVQDLSLELATKAVQSTSGASYTGFDFKHAAGNLSWDGGKVFIVQPGLNQTTQMPGIKAALSQKDDKLLVHLTQAASGADLAEAMLKSDGVGGVSVKKRLLLLARVPGITPGEEDKVVFNIQQPLF